MDFAILATFGAIAVGNYLAWGNIKYTKFFDLFRPASSGQQANKPAEIKVVDDKENGVILECTGIPIVDLVTPEQLAEVGLQSAEATLEKPAEEKAEKQQTKETPTQPKTQLYNITIKTKKRAEDITLAEVYFSDWQEKFEVTVTSSEGKPILPASAEYRKVVAILKTLLPSTSPSKKITQDPLISAFTADGGTIAFNNGKDPEFLEHNKEFNRALLRSVVETAKKGDHSCFDNYFEALKQGNRNGLFNAEKKRLELIEKKKKLEADLSAMGPKVKRRFVVVVSVLATILAVAGVITACVFFPLVALLPAVGTAIGPLISVAKSAIPGAVESIGGFAAILGFGRKFWRYINGYNEKAEIKKGLEEVNIELKETEEVEKILREEVGNKMEKAGVERVLEAIGVRTEKTDILKLEDIGHAGLMVLCDHLRDNKVPRYQKINLTGMAINKEGAETILEALSQNFTITELKDITVTDDVTIDITRQLLINRYLQGTVFDSDPQIIKLFGSAQNFKTDVIKKIKDNNTCEKITSFAEALEGLNPTKGKTLKEGVAQRVRNLCKLLYTNASASSEFRKAALVSSIMAIGIFGDLKYNHGGTYEELRNEFKEQSAILKQSGNLEDIKKAEQLDEILNKDFAEDLKMRYSCLSQANPNLAKDTQSIKELEQELRSNHDLRSFEFIGEKAHHGAREVVEFICHRNLLIEALEKRNMESFITEYSSIPVERCKDALKEIDKLKALKLVTSTDSSERGIAATCENLRKLDQQEGLTMLLEHCYSLNDAPSDAHKKAEIISALLNIPGLFEQPDDENKKAIKYEIYWATTPFGSWMGSKDVPYYNLGYLEPRLKEILTKIPEDSPYKAKLVEAIQPKPLESGVQRRGFAL